MQAVAVGGSAVQVIPRHVERDIILRRNRRFLPGKIQRHALWHKIFDVEIPHPLLVIAGTGAHMPHTGLRPAIKGIVKAIETVFRLADHGTCHLAVRA